MWEADGDINKVLVSLRGLRLLAFCGGAAATQQRRKLSWKGPTVRCLSNWAFGATGERDLTLTRGSGQDIKEAKFTQLLQGSQNLESSGLSLCKPTSSFPIIVTCLLQHTASWRSSWAFQEGERLQLLGSVIFPTCPRAAVRDSFSS